MFDASLRFGLPEEVEALADAVRRFAVDRIAPRAEEIDRTNDFPAVLLPVFGPTLILTED